MSKRILPKRTVQSRAEREALSRALFGGDVKQRLVLNSRALNCEAAQARSKYLDGLIRNAAGLK